MFCRQHVFCADILIFMKTHQAFGSLCAVQMCVSRTVGFKEGRAACSDCCAMNGAAAIWVKPAERRRVVRLCWADVMLRLMSESEPAAYPARLLLCLAMALLLVRGSPCTPQRGSTNSMPMGS
jgi:hypothetical protein